MDLTYYVKYKLQLMIISNKQFILVWPTQQISQNFEINWANHWLKYILIADFKVIVKNNLSIMSTKNADNEVIGYMAQSILFCI